MCRFSKLSLHLGRAFPYNSLRLGVITLNRCTLKGNPRIKSLSYNYVVSKTLTHINAMKQYSGFKI